MAASDPESEVHRATRRTLTGGTERPAKVHSRERSVVISRQGVHLFNAWLPAEHRAATHLMTKPDSLEESDTSNIATVRNAKHLRHARDGKEEPESVTDRSGSDAASLRGRRKSKADLPGQPVGRNEDADVANESIGIALGDTKLNPITECEKRCFAHFGEERQSLGIRHG